MGQALSVIGVVLQIAGVCIAGVGLWQTWHEFAQGEGFFDPLRQRAGEMGRRIAQDVRNAIARLLRRPRKPHVIGVSSIDSMSAVERARLRVTWDPLPPDTALALDELDRRTQQLSHMVANATDRHADELEEARTAAGTLARRVEEGIERLETKTRHVAIGGVRLEAMGLFLIALGLALQGVGALMGSPAPAHSS